MGYDISDYHKIDPDYGTLEDVDRLVADLHKRNMKLVMDLVVNHTSDQASSVEASLSSGRYKSNKSWQMLTLQHAWFKASKSSKDDPKRDWYIWRDPKYNANGERIPPNNWKSTFGS